RKGLGRLVEQGKICAPFDTVRRQMQSSATADLQFDFAEAPVYGKRQAVRGNLKGFAGALTLDIALLLQNFSPEPGQHANWDQYRSSQHYTGFIRPCPVQAAYILQMVPAAVSRSCHRRTVLSASFVYSRSFQSAARSIVEEALGYAD